jgi:enediyne biosynthesis protein E4
MAVVASLFFVSCQHKKLLFKQLLPMETGIHFTNHVIETDSFNVLTYPYILNGAGVGLGDVNNDGWEDVFLVGNQKGSNKLYINKANDAVGDNKFMFDDVTEKAGVKGKSDWCTGVSMVDIDSDGWLDIYVSTVSITGRLKSTNELYINNRNGTFTESAAAWSLDFSGHTTQAAFFDYDNDGDLDCFLLNHPVTYAEDYKDITARNTPDSLSGHRLLQNNNGKFVDISLRAGIYSNRIGYGLGIAVGDINNDGWQDIYVSNDFKENDYCYINNGKGGFSEKSTNLFGHMSRFSMGNDMADYDNDGWLDIITLDMLSPDEKIVKSSVSDDDIEVYDYKNELGFHYQFSKNCLQQNLGGHFFSEQGLQNRIAATDWSWAPLLADFDNDGNKDLYISNGFKYRVNDLDFNSFVQRTAIENQQRNIATNKQALIQKIPRGKVADYFYLNNSEAGFSDASVMAGFNQPTLSNGAAYADLDKDGDLDLVVNRMDEPAGVYKNEMPKKNHLSIALIGAGYNTQGIGAQVYVFTKQKIQLYHQSPARGFMSSVSPLLHVGIEDNTRVDSLVILWPDGRGQRLTQIMANKTITLYQQNAVENCKRPVLRKYLAENWQNVSDSSGIRFKHREDVFNDLNVQAFLPHSLASQGPELAVADVNADGREDFYVGGAKNQPGQIFIQTKNSVFVVSPQPSFIADSAFEDTGAVFFDADNDTDIDLYVTSGGNEYYGRSEWLKDRLYLNDGKGVFSRSNNIPDLFENKGCVRICDFDKDGDVDIFVGGRANARMYGYLPASVLLKNNGKGIFEETTENSTPGFVNMGMVTDACWTDIDKDGWMDLLVVGEWMPVTLFKNNKGKLTKQEVPELRYSSGWWNCLYAADLDKDGDEDYLLGNWGLNSKLKAGTKAPLRLYVADWDGNGETDPILAFYKSDQYYPFLGKADLEKRLPYIKKKYLDYTEIAGKTVAEIFGEKAIEKARVLNAFTLQSSVLWNIDGHFLLEPLPTALQQAPVFAFSRSSHRPEQFIAGGNFYEVSPYEGRYDALLPCFFSIAQQQVRVQEYLLEKGCIRTIVPIRLQNGKAALLVGKNNDTLKLLTAK